MDTFCDFLRGTAECVRVSAVLRKNHCFSGGRTERNGTERTDIGSEKLADVIGASRNYYDNSTVTSAYDRKRFDQK